MHFDNNPTYASNRISYLLSFLLYHILWITLTLSRAFLSILFLTGCSPDVLPETESVEARTHFSFYDTKVQSEGSTMDILVFENDRLCRLDAYQRLTYPLTESVYAESTGGAKIFVFCSNSGKDRYDWTDINSYGALRKITFNLEEQDHEHPTCIGECRMEAGGKGGELLLRPLVSAVCLKSICCDFTGTPYAGCEITDVCAYLTNVNATYCMIDTDFKRPARIINNGMLNQEDLKNFNQKDLIYSKIIDRLGTVKVHPDVCFLCFPNPGKGNVLGSPCTRLVIEGKIEGQTYYWPININKEDSGDGIERNHRYTFDIIIRRRGTSDPDTPIDICQNEIKFEAIPWEEKGEYAVHF